MPGHPHSLQSVVQRSVVAPVLGLVFALLILLGVVSPQAQGFAVSKLSVGGAHTCATGVGGAAYCWGSNITGQLGNGWTTNSPRAVEVNGISSGATSISSGAYHSCAVVSGGAKCWGSNFTGSLGDGTTLQRTSPVNVSGLTSAVKSISAGFYYTCALTDAGAVKCWGAGTLGQLGNGQDATSPIPQDVTGLSSGVVAIATASSFACALKDTGAVVCWGSNTYGIGDGTTEALEPVEVIDSSIKSIGSDSQSGHMCAVRTTGSVRCWGSGTQGELGNGIADDSAVPVIVLGLDGPAQTVATGGGHTCAAETSGKVECWGADASGALGNGSSDDSLTPEPVADVNSVELVEAGSATSCAKDRFGGVKCWGEGEGGRLGNDATSSVQSASDVFGTDSAAGAQMVSSGGAHSCAISAAGALECWGFNALGQIGNPAGGSVVSTPVRAVGLDSNVTSVATGYYHSCAVMAGAAKCWGGNYSGALGDGSTAHRNVPTQVDGLSENIASVSAGQQYSCAVTTAGAAKCWGEGSSGQLGSGVTADSSTPVDVVGLSSGVKSIAAGQTQTCAIVGTSLRCWGETIGTSPVTVNLGGAAVQVDSDASASHFCAILQLGTIKCWGHNSDGQLGNGESGTSSAIPVLVSDPGERFISVAVGGSSTCAVTTRARTKCWGSDHHGQLGNGSEGDSLVPRFVQGESDQQAVAAGSSFACSVQVFGGLQCWGDAGVGMLGNGATAAAQSPSAVRGFDPPASGLHLSTGGAHSCVISFSQEAYCWGSNFVGQLGDGTTLNRSWSRKIGALASPVTSISTGWLHTCAVSAGAVKCWGNNSSRQLGDGTSAQRLTPVQVVGLTSGMKSVVAGAQFTCALSTAGGVKCWGQNYAQQLGNGSTTASATPVDVIGLTSGVKSISISNEAACALTNGGAVKCWGRVADTPTPPVTVISSGATSIASDSAALHFCAVMSNGGAKCWGTNYEGELGDGNSETESFTPVTVVGIGAPIVSIAVGQYFTCAVEKSGALRCWGSDHFGQLGNGTESGSTAVPQLVAGLSSIKAVDAGFDTACALDVFGAAKCWGSGNDGKLGTGNDSSSQVPVGVLGLQ